MCANYKPPEVREIEGHWALRPGDFKFPSDVYPQAMAPIIRRAHGVEDLECVPAMFGMVPHWADKKLARSTYNARSETVQAKPSFRNAWEKSQFCIIPASAIYEPNYESGKAVRWQIAHQSGRPLGIAGIWEWKANHEGSPLLSFSMLTINADDHALMRRFHKPGDEKRMVVFLEPQQYDQWLHGTALSAPGLLRQYSAQHLVASPAPRAPTQGDAKKAA